MVVGTSMFINDIVKWFSFPGSISHTFKKYFAYFYLAFVIESMTWANF